MALLLGTALAVGICTGAAAARWRAAAHTVTAHSEAGGARAGEPRWGVEAVLAAYGALVALGVGALLASQADLLARSITSYEARQLRRRGQPLPPVQSGLRGMGLIGPLLLAMAWR